MRVCVQIDIINENDIKKKLNVITLKICLEKVKQYDIFQKIY